MFIDKSDYKEFFTTNSSLRIQGPSLIKPQIFKDKRGYFFESWNEIEFNKILGEKIQFKQDNHSQSKFAVLRGLHYQLPPFQQGKLVRCTMGSIFDVAVDLRKKSKTFGKWMGIELSQNNNFQFWIPGGFAHGFLTLSEVAQVQYKASDYWNKDAERSLIWNDIDLSINWPIGRLKGVKPLLSKKDKEANTFSDFCTFGK